MSWKCFLDKDVVGSSINSALFLPSVLTLHNTDLTTKNSYTNNFVSTITTTIITTASTFDHVFRILPNQSQCAQPTDVDRHSPTVEAQEIHSRLHRTLNPIRHRPPSQTRQIRKRISSQTLYDRLWSSDLRQE